MSPALTSRTEDVLAFVCKHPGCSTGDLVKFTGRTNGQVMANLTTLLGYDLIGRQEQFPPTASGYLRWYPAKAPLSYAPSPVANGNGPAAPKPEAS